MTGKGRMLTSAGMPLARTDRMIRVRFSLTHAALCSFRFVKGPLMAPGPR